MRKRKSTYHAATHLRSRLRSILARHLDDKGQVMSPAGLAADLRRVLG